MPIHISDEMVILGTILQTAKEHGLEVEVIAWAMLALKENPKLSISEAILIGFAEWVK